MWWCGREREGSLADEAMGSAASVFRWMLEIAEIKEDDQARLGMDVCGEVWSTWTEVVGSMKKQHKGDEVGSDVEWNRW